MRLPIVFLRKKHYLDNSSSAHPLQLIVGATHLYVARDPTFPTCLIQLMHQVHGEVLQSSW